MGRPKKSVPAPIEPEDASQEEPDEEPAVVIEPEPVSLPTGAVSQSDAARAALDAGYEKPAQAVEYIKATFGIDMDPQYFSAIKSRTKAAGGEAKTPSAPKGKPGRKPKAAAPATTSAAPSPKHAASNGELDLLGSLETLKPLIAAMGAEKVHRLVDLLG
jgi:hypothetical protein